MQRSCDHTRTMDTRTPRTKVGVELALDADLHHRVLVQDSVVVDDQLLEELVVGDGRRRAWDHGITVRAAPLVRAKVKITVKNVVYEESSATGYGVFDWDLVLTLKSGALLLGPSRT